MRSSCRSVCFFASWTVPSPRVGCMWRPLDGWCISVPGVSIGRYPSQWLVCSRIMKGHSLGLALRVVTVPGVTSVYSSDLAISEAPRLEYPDLVAALGLWWRKCRAWNHFQHRMGNYENQHSNALFQIFLL
ncbi:hypothetical protein AVEN_76433-1 [Araneus ventricosus]|uniref:Uncharacterized protein n=1 Tax=Araneus ventricosus TaxID=182803 RepID=A0A4Y2WGF3_ARAVE|nr:hypothetical protein AVEN_76433-1 [Araneus ventricosus]